MMEIRGILRTRHSRAECIAASLRPDNLQSMRTWSEGGQVVTEIRGDSLRSVIASVDDYLMNLAIAEDLCSLVPEKGEERAPAPRRPKPPCDGQGETR
ncbi:MAG TPA: KEOPS complex subunit Pcc1 [Methanolinea sp.]|jgi:hypothetical protein|nr:KEOPS complex subunit Pcc1 [Methanolinea sp.]HPC55924.1 KEOPS complex subunit Pcc1 [Methanolinea sp.]HQE85486.1 KEOPS complex subunit Pcc1 [Methanolinea sp.]HQI14338.1 KEOPS complex subunit Pcc1 [Methanolinea sp.]HQJ18558.1 KEOPS complex subunit Pcc1 [Methanolinea sp.]